MYYRSLACICSLTILLLARPASAQSDECVEIGKVVSAQGNVKVLKSNSGEWRRVSRKSPVCEGDTVETGTRSRAAIKLDNETLIRVRQQSKATLEGFSAQEESTSIMRMITGIIQFFSREPQEYSIATTTATIGIRGTEFVVIANDDSTSVSVYEGAVLAENDVAPVTLRSGETVTIESGTSPNAERIVDGREQVQWGLYYPPVLAIGSAGSDTLDSALICANQGDFACAFDTLENIPASERDVNHAVYLAALLLAVGDIEAADQQLAGVDGGNANALALQAVVALIQGRNEAAASAAREALEANPESAAARVAMSYVLQAELELEAARNQLLQAVEVEPENALAWARLAELQLALGNSTDSRTAADRAVSLNTGLSRTHMAAGYGALAEMDDEAATEAFERALALDDADPMAHLGLGLALIRGGHLVAGRTEIEAAVGLDSNSAILRPYLGRAYFEEDRSPLAAEQYSMAKQLDPEDPTPYLFEALRLHAGNQPVAARAELEASIERNDNRAVYRGRNLLDQDRAARGASLARIYDTLDFNHQGRLQASSSLSDDPTNASAHRFLSDSYRSERRREIARVSELLQAQMLQDINLNPVQPSVSSANINLGQGAGEVGLNEFTGLFEREGVQANITARAGENETSLTEAVITGMVGSISFSLGGLSHETDGWRENNGIDQDLGNAFIQWAVSPRLNLQAEVTTRDSTEGDLSFDFDPDDFDDTLEHEREFDTERIGLRYSPSAKTDILFSHIESERSEQRTAIEILPVLVIDIGGPVPPLLEDHDTDIGVDDDGSQTEFQYLLNAGDYNLTAGIASADIDTVTRTDIAWSNPLVPVFPVLGYVPIAEDSSEIDSNLKHERFYLYSTWNPSPELDITLGVSADDYDDDSLTESITTESPKIGLVWRAGQRHTFRFAALEATKPSLANNRTLEPTQVAGFNQLFDDINGTQTEFLGIGYDLRLSKTANIGFELTSRELEIPFLFFDIATTTESTEFEEQEEDISRLYFNWTPSDKIAVGIELVSDRFESGSDSDVNTPVEADTDSLPVSVKYFSPEQWFAGITVTRVEQEIERNVFSTQAGGDESFTVVDLAFGYRLPRRMGSISIEIQNAADEEFMYQDDSYREFRDEPSTGPYFPDRTTMLSANFVF